MIKSVQKTLKILEVLSRSQGNSVPLGKIAEKAGINKSTCAHLMETLENEGYAVKISPAKGYVLGPAAYCLSNSGRYKKDLVTIARPVINYLYKSLGYCVVLAVIENDEKYIIDYIDDGSIFREKKKILRDDIYRTATGRALLLNLPVENIVSVYRKFGTPSEKEWGEVKSLDDILKLKKETSESDVFFSRTDNGDTLGLGFAMPFFNDKGCVGAVGIAVNVTLNEEKNFAEQEKKIINVLRKGVKELSRRIKL